MTPVADREPQLEPSGGGGGAARATLYGALALLLAAGAWVRFAPEIGQVAPQLSPPVAASPAARPDGKVATLVEARSVPAADVTAAIAAMKLPSAQQAALADAVRRDRLRLVTLPLFDAGLANPDGTDSGRTVTVSTAGFSRVVPLGRQPVPVVLPIDRAGTVTFQVASASPAGPVGMGALTVTGPVRFPDLGRGDVLSVGVMAQ